MNALNSPEPGKIENWMRGFEIELMAPQGSSREDLAKALAQSLGGSVRRIFYPQSELAVVAGDQAFETLTLGFQTLDSNGRVIATCVDDITLNADLNLDREGKAGWYRILSSSKVILDLVEKTCSPDQPLENVLTPLAQIFESPVFKGEHNVSFVDSKSGTVAMAFPLAGDRERACELISPPLTGDTALLQRYLTKVLKTAADMHFLIPKESATHIHFDGGPLMNPRSFQNLIQIFEHHRHPIREISNTNSNCTRLGPWPHDFLKIVKSEQFLTWSWPEAAQQLMSTSIAKWCDFNVVNLIDPYATKRTFEVRTLGTSFDANRLVSLSHLFAHLLNICVTQDSVSHLLPNTEKNAHELFAKLVASAVS